jgi:hypothetical protein
MAALTAASLVGCGVLPAAPSNAPGRPGAVRVASEDPILKREDSGKTGVGNHFKVRVYRYNADDSTVKVDVTYEDRTSYFSRLGPALEIGGFAEVRMVNGDRRTFSKFSLHQPSGGTPIRNGSVTLGGVSKVEDVRSVEVAFHYGGMWDSNHGKNYVVTF